MAEALVHFTPGRPGSRELGADSRTLALPRGEATAVKAGVVGLAPAGEAKRLRAGPPPITSRGSREPSQLRFRS